MNKQALLETAFTYWADEDQCFIAYSPLEPLIIGDGDTPEQALSNYREHVETQFEAFKQNKHARYETVGRPRKGKGKFACEINPELRQQLAEAAKSLQVSQGELVEVVFAFWLKRDALSVSQVK